MKFKIKFKCNQCNKYFYLKARCKSRKDAKRFKNEFKDNDDNLLHFLSSDSSNCI